MVPPPPSLATGSVVRGVRLPSITICLTCRHDGVPDSPVVGPALLAETRAAAPAGVRVRAVRCLGNCSRGASAVVCHDGAWAYVFGHLAPGDGADLVEGACLLGGSGDGLMPWRGRPEVLKRGLIARLPPADYEDAP